MPSFSRSRNDAPNAIVGAARRIRLNRQSDITQMRMRPTEHWQELAWEHYDSIGEIKFAFNYFAAVASRIRFFVGYQEKEGDSPSEIGKVDHLDRSFVTAARYEFAKLGKGIGGQPNLIRNMTLNLLVAGECYLCGMQDSWSARSVSEIKFDSAGRIRLQPSRNSASFSYLPENAYLARIWRTHPRYSDDADSSLLGIANECAELLLLSRIIRATGQSRLNAGIMYVADELRFTRASDPTDATLEPDVDPFEEELTLALTEPIGTTDSPSEVVPMIVRGPAEYSDKGIKYIDMGRGFSKELIERYEQTLARVLNGIDLPRDLISGLANVRFSNGKVITEDLLKSHVEPLVVMLCEGITSAYLKARMLARGYDQSRVDKLMIWYDASEVVISPDQSENADKGYLRMTVSGATWRKAHGFNEDDAPSDEELALRIALAGSVAPSTTLDFLRKVAPELMAQVEQLSRASFESAEDETADEAPTPAAPQPAPPPAPPGPNTNPSEVQSDPPEGNLPPAVAAGLSPRDEHVFAMLTQFAAQKAKRPSAALRERERQLERTLEVERRLRDALFVRMNDVVGRSLEKAGARTVSKIRGNPELKALAASVASECVFAAIPSANREELGLNPDELVRDTIDAARDSFTELIRDAQDQGWKELGVFESMKPKQSGMIETAWRWFASQLKSLARQFLKQPRTSGTFVDMESIRTATAMAGGAEVVTAANSGRAVLSEEALSSTEWEFGDRYRWVYGISENSFEPHKRLDGRIFVSWTGTELKSGDGDTGWPYVTHYFPGDHTGCRCDWLPEVLDPALVNKPERGNTWGGPDEAPVAASMNGATP